MELTEHGASRVKCHFKERCGVAEETIVNLGNSTPSCFAWETTVPKTENPREM